MKPCGMPMSTYVNICVLQFLHSSKSTVSVLETGACSSLLRENGTVLDILVSISSGFVVKESFNKAVTFMIE